MSGPVATNPQAVRYTLAMSNYDVAIAGGGIIGGAVALALARGGRRVVLLDRQEPGREASWAAAGMLSPQPDKADAIALVPLARASLEIYPEFIAEVEEISGEKTGFRASGALELFFGDAAESERDAVLAVHRGVGLASEAISAAEALQLEPSLSPRTAAALRIPYEGSVDNRLLTAAVLEAARRSGVVIRASVEVEDVVVQDGRCVGVLAGDEKIFAGQVVIAAGCASAGIRAVARWAPTLPARGQMVALRSNSVCLARNVHHAGMYVVPRKDGRLIAGSTIEYAGVEKAVTPAGLKAILRAAVELLPALDDAAIIETWSGLRPDTPDHLPILGPTEIAGLWIATGHFRNGILLAPITARLIAAWLEGKPAPLPVEEFSPLRFAEKGQTAAR